ncbi:hypothetical protein [Jannaschia sp. LMIT008]|uniref:hypothetical protein n=1 Tax=Jannaschia maritima TaxID=3032585 RepID=UPI002811D064|nr:hypothetical protein [Jannaschia sp. LMIT008]
MNTWIGIAGLGVLLGGVGPDGGPPPPVDRDWPALRLAQAAVGAPDAFAVTEVGLVVQVDGVTVMVDPVGPQSAYLRFGRPDVVILTRADPAHLSVETMIGLLRRDTVVLAPRAVIDRLPAMIANNVVTPFEAGTTQMADGIRFRALDADAGVPAGARAYARERGDIGVVMEAAAGAFFF